MNNKAIALKVINDYGWLAIRELWFDGGHTVAPFITDGMIACTDDAVYWIYSTSVADHEQYNKHLFVAADREYSRFKQLRVCNWAELFKADVVMYGKWEEIVKEMKTSPLYNFKAPKTYTKIMHGTPEPVLKAEDEALEEGESVSPSGAVVRYKVSEAFDLGDGTFMPRAFFEKWINNHEEFKKYLSDTFGIPLLTLK